MACPQQTLCFCQYFLRGAAARTAARLGHDAVCTAVGTAVLHLEYWPGPSKTMYGKGWPGYIRGGFSLGPGAMQQQAFLFLRHEQVGLLERCARAWLEGGKKASGTACEDEPSCRGLPTQPEDGIAGIALAPGSYGTTVDADDISFHRAQALRASQFVPGFPQSLAFILINFAAKGHNMEFPAGHAR